VNEIKYERVPFEYEKNSLKKYFCYGRYEKKNVLGGIAMKNWILIFERKIFSRLLNFLI